METMTTDQMQKETLMIRENMKAAIELMVRRATGMVETLNGLEENNQRMQILIDKIKM